MGMLLLFGNRELPAACAMSTQVGWLLKLGRDNVGGRRFGAIAALCVFAASCASQPAPAVDVSCTPTKISVQIGNVSDRPARYFVAVEVRAEGLVTEELFSTNDVAPGSEITVEEPRIGDPGDSCVVTSTKTYAALGT